jgi:hypothetical protein
LAKLWTLRWKTKPMVKLDSLTDRSLIYDISCNNQLMGDDCSRASERLPGEISVLAMFTIREQVGLEWIQMWKLQYWPPAQEIFLAFFTK